MLNIAATNQIHPMTGTPAAICIGLIVLVIVAMFVAIFLEDAKKAKEREERARKLGARLANAKVANCNNLDFIEEIYLNGSLDHTEQLLKDAGF